jgi:hypothetical protein
MPLDVATIADRSPAVVRMRWRMQVAAQRCRFDGSEVQDKTP